MLEEKKWIRHNSFFTYNTRGDTSHLLINDELVGKQEMTKKQTCDTAKSDKSDTSHSRS